MPWATAPRALVSGCLSFSMLPAVVSAQAPPPPPPPLVSPEVHADGRVTFRFRAPNAKEVFLNREGAERQPMQRDEQGVFTLTTGPLEPDLYGYGFVADGVSYLDPANHVFKPNLLNTQNLVHVPGPAELPWEVADVPRGSLHRHFYRSAVGGDVRDYFVYTPPQYFATADARYPVLYLLHGFSDDASGWTAVGRAHVILDNLIARGQAKPMLVVMTLGYGAPEILKAGFAGMRDMNARRRNIDKFRESLVTEVIPAVEKAYRVAPGREARAIAGLSMGGGQSLTIGLSDLDRFAWVGAFSSAVPEDPDKALPGLDAKANERLRALWIACGKDDFLYQANRRFFAWLGAKGIRHAAIETSGGHTWMVWRRNLAAFAPLLFR